MHNKGGAVDITLVDSLGNELPMGTEFDHFGIEAHHGYTKLPQKIIENRKLLKSTMEKNGFRSITTEWWHYDFQSVKKYPNSNFPVKCQ
jgi:D-alanyl-D-alanine dipeptidase